MRLSKLTSAILLASIGFSAQASEGPSAWDILIKSSETTYWSVSAESAEAQARYLEARNRLERAGQSEPTVEELAAQLKAHGLVSEEDLAKKIAELSSQIEDSRNLSVPLATPPASQDGIPSARQAPDTPVASGPATVVPTPSGSAARVPSVQSDPEIDWTPLVVGRNVDQKRYVDLKRGPSVRRVFSGETVDGWKVDISDAGIVTLTRGKVKKTL